MGIGDEVMVTGEIKRLAGGTAKRFAVRDPRDRAAQRGTQHRWVDIWDGNPRIARPGEAFDEWYTNAPGVRPYIGAKGQMNWVWKPYVPEPGEIFLTDAERALGREASGFVIVQPSIKAGAPVNKQWGWARWQELVKLPLRAPYRWLQVGTEHERRLGVDYLQTNTFREACAALAFASAAVLQEGGLHHAAAVFGTPAVVIFGGYISPRVTGYKTQRSLFVDFDGRWPLGCGMRMACKHCEFAMRKITPQKVFTNVEELLT